MSESLKERWHMSYISLEPQITIVTIFYANILIYSMAKIWLSWRHEKIHLSFKSSIRVYIVWVNVLPSTLYTMLEKATSHHIVMPNPFFLYMYIMYIYIYRFIFSELNMSKPNMRKMPRPWYNNEYNFRVTGSQIK